MDNNIKETPITPESVLAAVEKMFEKSGAEWSKTTAEVKEMFAETRAELAASSAQFKEDLAASSAKFDREMEKLTEQQAETDRLIKANAKQMGGMCNSNGDAATEFFFNSLNHKRRNIFGENFDGIFKEEKRKTKQGAEDEYDILMFNGRAACIVEVKYKADTDDVQQVLKKERTFRANFPEYSDKKLYLALASMSFHKRVEKACNDNGIAIIKQAGDTILINDKHLKVF
jgi:hypothetical protein